MMTSAPCQLKPEENTELVLDVLELAQGDILFEDPSANFGREQPAVAPSALLFVDHQVTHLIAYFNASSP